MRLYNESRYPDDEVRALVEFAAGDMDTAGVAVKVKNRRRGVSGYCYHGVPSISPISKLRTVKRLITIKIGEADQIGDRDWHSSNYKTAVDIYFDNNWARALLYVAAHEFQHHYQMENGRKLSEVDAIRYGSRRLLEWEKAQNPHLYLPQEDAA